MRGRSRSPSRLLAPLGIVAFLVAFVIVLSNSGVNHDGGGAATTSSTTSTTPTPTTKTGKRFAHRRTYTVRTGDTLGAISIKTGVSVSTLEDLNPGLDPTGLVAGQKIKLR